VSHGHFQGCKDVASGAGRFPLQEKLGRRQFDGRVAVLRQLLQYAPADRGGRTPEAGTGWRIVSHFVTYYARR